MLEIDKVKDKRAPILRGERIHYTLGPKSTWRGTAAVAGGAAAAGSS